MRTWRRKILNKLLSLELERLNGNLIDIGGERKSLRSCVYGQNNSSVKVTVVNIDPDAGADIVWSVEHLPFNYE